MIMGGFKILCTVANTVSSAKNGVNDPSCHGKPLVLWKFSTGPFNMSLCKSCKRRCNMREPLAGSRVKDCTEYEALTTAKGLVGNATADQPSKLKETICPSQPK
jgi:hypothetical protein